MKLSHLLAGLAVALSGLVHAADPLPIQVVGTITTQNLVSAGTCTAASCVEYTTQGIGTVGVQVTGTYTGALSGQGTIDGSTWVTLTSTSTFTNQAGTTSATITSGSTGLYTVNVAGYKRFRITGLAAMTGTATVSIQGTAGGGGSGGSGGGSGGAVTIADGADASAGSTSDAAATAGGTGTGSAKLRLVTSQLDTLHTDITATNGQLPPTTGAQTSANSLSIVPSTTATFTVVPNSTTPSSDTTRMPISAPDNKCTTATASANGVMTGSPYTFPMDTTGYDSITVHITTAGTGSINYEQSNDSGATFVATVGTASTSTGGGSSVSVTTSVTGLYKFPVAGQYYQQRVTGYVAPITTVTCLRKSAMQGTIGANIPNVLVANISQMPGWTVAHMSTATTTTHKSGSGVLHNLCVNSAGAGSTATVYDNTAGSGTVIAVIDGSSARCLQYDATFSTGLTITTTATAPDLTITYR